LIPYRAMLAVPAEMARYLTLSVVQPDAERGQRGESAGKRQLQVVSMLVAGEGKSGAIEWRLFHRDPSCLAAPAPEGTTSRAAARMHHPRSRNSTDRWRLAHCGAAPASSSHDATMTTQTPQSRENVATVSRNHRSAWLKMRGSAT
jgi:hypothetical protein